MTKRFGLLTTFPAAGSQNVGDALITDSLKRIILHLAEGTTFLEAFRGDDLSGRLDEFNACDALLLPGFAIRQDTWPNIYALTDPLHDLQVPLVGIGAGVKDDSAYRLDQSHNLTFSTTTRQLLQRVVTDSALIATRDPYTQDSVSAHGFPANIVGDCALFDPSQIGTPLQRPPAVHSVAFTAPRRQHLVDQATEIINAIRRFWPRANIAVFRHGRPNATELTVEERVGGQIVEVFGEDTANLVAHHDFDIHVGYRVHAHLYRLRSRSPSLLLEEDSRAIGFNRLLGLEGVPSTTVGHPVPRRNLLRAVLRQFGVDAEYRRRPRLDAPRKVVDILKRYEVTGFSEFESALGIIDWHYQERMVPFLRKFL